MAAVKWQRKNGRKIKKIKKKHTEFHSYDEKKNNKKKKNDNTLCEDIYLYTHVQ